MAQPKVCAKAVRGACGSRAARGNRGESESKGMKQNETEEIIMKKTYLLEGLDCANCAAEVERNVAKLDNVNSASVNFLTLKMVLDVKMILVDIQHHFECQEIDTQNGVGCQRGSF